MAFKPENIDDILRVGRDIERIQADYADVIQATQRAADQMKDLIDPPVLRRLREMHDLMLSDDIQRASRVLAEQQRLSALYCGNLIPMDADSRDQNCGDY